jgi:hexokinase
VHHNVITRESPLTLFSSFQVINTEWGNFSSPCLPITEYDQALDEESQNPREQASFFRKRKDFI